MDRELLLSRASCIIPDAPGIRKCLFDSALRRFKTGHVTEEQFVIYLEEVEEKNRIYLRRIKRLETIRKTFYTIPFLIKDDRKHLKRKKILEFQLGKFKFDNEKYVSGKIIPIILDMLEDHILGFFFKCYQARLTLLMIRMFRSSELSAIPKDVVKLIGMKIWKTRFDEEWLE